MKTARLVRGVMITLAAVGMCVPPVAFAAEPAPAPAVVDVALSDGGVLHGQVLNLQGAGVAGVPVLVKTQDRDVAAATTAADGTFNIQGLRGGMYQVVAAQGQGVYRLWSAGTAPPVAQTSATVYSQNGTVDRNAVVYTQNACCDSGTQGCCCEGGGLKAFLTNPIVIAGIVATAIAVPLALSNQHHASH